MGKFVPSSRPSAPPPPPPPPPVPTQDDAAIKAEGKKKAADAKMRKGFASTIKTGGLGVTEAPQVDRKTLLGS